MQPLNIKLYDLARAKLHLNDNDAMDFVSSIHELQDHRFENLVTKEYLDQKLLAVTERMNQIDSNAIDRTNLSDLKQFQEISDLKITISEFKSEILKWIFIFWVGQMSITIAIVLMFIKK